MRTVIGIGSTINFFVPSHQFIEWLGQRHLLLRCVLSAETSRTGAQCRFVLWEKDNTWALRLVPGSAYREILREKVEENQFGEALCFE